MGMIAIMLFVARGFGARALQTAMRLPGGLASALAIFAAAQLLAGLVAIPLFQGEHAQHGK